MSKLCRDFTAKKEKSKTLDRFDAASGIELLVLSHATCICLQRLEGLGFPISALIFDFECDIGPSVKLTTRMVLKCLACPTWKYFSLNNRWG